MIYTVTLNPSIDYVVETDKLKIGEVNRSNKEELYPGGKGINVSLMLKELQVENTALGFLGGFIGEYIENALAFKPHLLDKEQEELVAKVDNISELAEQVFDSLRLEFEDVEVNGQKKILNQV